MPLVPLPAGHQSGEDAWQFADASWGMHHAQAWSGHENGAVPQVQQWAPDQGYWWDGQSGYANGFYGHEGQYYPADLESHQPQWTSSGWWDGQATPGGWEAEETNSVATVPASTSGKKRGGAKAKQKAANDNMDEHMAQVHFTKTYQVLSEVLEAHAAAFKGVQSFVDLGCAPGGFSGRLLEENATCHGFGITLPTEAGGFPILLADSRFTVHRQDLMTLESLDEVGCPPEVDACIADAQDLGRRTSASQRGGKAGGKGKAAGRTASTNATQATQFANAGIKAVCAVLGIWALTLQELMLGLGRLRSGGTFFFRFGWRGHGNDEEFWYLEATHRLLALILTHFAEVIPFKSEFSHQADSTFYIVATGFKRQDFIENGIGAALKEAIEKIISCDQVENLPACIEALEPLATEEIRTRGADILDTVGRMRAIGVASRQRLQAGCRTNPEAAVWISPVPYPITLQKLRQLLEWYGKISHVKWRSHPVGVGADATVYFVQRAHAMVALQAITETKVLGENIKAKLLSEAVP